VIAALASDFTTYAVDLVGFGKTPATPTFAYTMKAQAEAVAAFISATGIPDPILVGHSMGGGVCLHTASGAGPKIGRMVLIAPVAFLPVTTFASLQSPAAPVGKPKSAAHAIAERLLRLAYAPGNQPTEDQIDGYAAGLSTAEHQQAFLRHAGTLAFGEVPLPGFGGIANDTLVIWGEEDKILSADHGRQLATALNNATLETLAGCGHVPHEELPAATLAKITRFLGSPGRAVVGMRGDQ
jgi:pimeloyl-ACP methyl ester carboxylesterase